MPRKKKDNINIETSSKANKAKLAIKALNKKFGYEALKPASEEKERERIPFDLDILNDLTGGGIPLGMFSILWGNKSCFVKGTKVLMSDYTIKNIEEVKVGDEVLSFNEFGTKSLKSSKVLNTFVKEAKEVFLLKTDKAEVICTPNHKILMSSVKNDNWVKAINIRYNTECYYFPFRERNYEWKRGWILGAILSDGSTTAGIHFYNKNKVLIEVFKKYLEEIYQIHSPSEIVKSNGVTQISVKNNFFNKSIKVLYNLLLRQENNFTKDFSRGLLAGFFDGNGTDGNKYKTEVRLINTDYPLLEALKKEMDFIGLKGKIVNNGVAGEKVIRGIKYNTKRVYYLSITGSIKFFLECLPHTKKCYNLGINKGFKQKIQFKAKRKVSELVYDLETESSTYIANGFPVHNCGKTTHAYGIIARAQKLGKLCAFFDLENSFDAHWAKNFGVDVNKLLIGHFDTAEQAMDTFIELADKEAIDFVVLDSIQSLSPEGEQHKKKSEKLKSTADDTMALLARKLSQFFRMSAGRTYRANTGLLLIGQARTDLGGFIPIQKISGGNALEHWASLILHIRRGTKADAPRYKFKNKDGKKREIIIGFDTCMVLDKKKIPHAAPEKTEIHFPFYEGRGWKEPTNEQIEETYGDWIEFESEADSEEE